MTKELVDTLQHAGVKGMKWGVRKKVESVGRKTATKVERTAYRVGAKLNPREFKYRLRKLTNNPTEANKLISNMVQKNASLKGTLPTNKNLLKAVETAGIQKHKEAKYDNLTSTDIARFKTYTDSARYSRNVNTFLAIGTPKEYAEESAKLKESLSKNKIHNQTVYRSCNYKFTTNGLSRKMDQYGEDKLAEIASEIGKNFSGKSIKENRVFSTSTSPLFAIDTWRSVNPTAASTYNTYMIINSKGASGVYADGKTKDGKSLVNTKSNQECILAPDKLTYRKVEYDKERGMFAITVDAE